MLVRQALSCSRRTCPTLLPSCSRFCTPGLPFKRPLAWNRFQSTPAYVPPAFAPPKSKLWYNKHGKRRFTWGVVSLTLYSLLSTFIVYELVSLVEDLEHANYFLTCFIDIARVDANFPNVDLSDRKQALMHFRELCGSFGEVPPEIIDDFFEDVALLDGDEAIELVRQICARVHDVLTRSRTNGEVKLSRSFTTFTVTVEAVGEYKPEIAAQLVEEIDNAMVQLIEMVDNALMDKTKLLRGVKIREQMSKDLSGRSSGEKTSYEEVG